MNLKRNRQQTQDTPIFALCYRHSDQFGNIVTFSQMNGSAMKTYILYAACAKALGRSPTQAQMARIEAYIAGLSS